MQSQRRLWDNLIIDLQREAIDLVAEEKRVSPVLLDDAPERYEIVLLRVPHDLLEKNLRLVTRDKGLECFSSLRQQSAIPRKRQRWKVGSAKQRSLSYDLSIPPFAPPVQDAVGAAHAALHDRPAHLACIANESLFESIRYVGRLRPRCSRIYRRSPIYRR